jgi:hypothetical protein
MAGSVIDSYVMERGLNHSQIAACPQHNMARDIDECEI